MNPRPRRRMLYGLTLLILFVAGLDFLLWHLDPSGIVRYWLDYNDLQSHALPAPDGLRYVPGHYRFRTYEVTIGLDGFRAVPSNQGGACRIVFIGDSVTFAQSSSLSFVEILAADLPATVINAGIPGYNIGNILPLVEALPADGYIYTVFFNDAYPPITWKPTQDTPPPALVLYRDLYLTPLAFPPIDPAAYAQQAAPLIQRDDVLTFAFDGQALTDIAAQTGAQRIPMYTRTASRFDGHASAAGNTEIAAAMRPAVLDFVARRC